MNAGDIWIKNKINQTKKHTNCNFWNKFTISNIFDGISIWIAKLVNLIGKPLITPETKIIQNSNNYIL